MAEPLGEIAAIERTPVAPQLHLGLLAAEPADEFLYRLRFFSQIHERQQGRIDFRIDERPVLLIEILQPTGCHKDIGVVNFTRLGIYAGRPDSEGRLARHPPNGVVAHVFGIPRRILFLVPNLDGVDKPGALEGLVPLENPFANDGAVFVRHRFLDIKHDRLLRRRPIGLRIGLLKIPTVDIPHKGLFRPLLRIVFHRRYKVAHPRIGETRLVPRLGNLGNTVMNRHRQRTGVRHRARVDIAAAGECGLDFHRHVLRKGLYRAPQGPVLIYPVRTYHATR